jgi:hypothetical protein
MRVSVRAGAAFTVAALWAGAVARAQEEPAPPPVAPRPQEEPPPPPPKPRDAEGAPTAGKPPVIDPTSEDFTGFALGDESDELVIGDERVFAATGTVSQPVRVRLAGFELRCESMVLWGDRDRLVDALQKHREELNAKDPDKILGPLVHALYAEGGVFLQTKGRTIRADRAFLDFQRGKAYLVRAHMTADMEGRQGRPLPLSVRADVIRATSRDHYRAEDAKVTTCSYSDPHYDLEARWIEVDYSHAWATFETSSWPTVRVDTAAADKTPILTFPKLAGNSGLASTPIQGVSAGHSSRFGTMFGITWGADIRRDDGSKWGEWRLHTDYKSQRGPGACLDVSHKSPPSQPNGQPDEFEFTSYFQRDSASTDSYSGRAFDGTTNSSGNRNNRGFAHLWDRWFVEDKSITDAIGTGWRVDSEVSYYSDRGYFGEYDSAKTNSEKEQETFVQARKLWGNQGVSLLTSYRLNGDAASLDEQPGDLTLTNFENQTQYSPSGTYHLINQPILSADKTGIFPLNLSVEASAANVKRRYDNSEASQLNSGIGWRGQYVRRGDVETRITAPFSVGDVHFNPAFGGSFMDVSDANGFSTGNDPSNSRYTGFWDMRAGTQAWKVFPDAKSEFLDVDGLRHIASLDAQYFDRFKVSTDPGTYQPNDMIDELQEETIASIRLRNRFETKRDGEVVDWLDYEARFLYYFHENTPTDPRLFGVREDFAQPLQNLDFPGESKYSSVARDGSAYWQHRARFEALKELWFFGEADYDMQRQAMETSGLGVRWFADRRMSFYVGRRTIHSDSTIWTERMDYQLSKRWGVEVEAQEDTKADQGLRSKLSLYRRAHDYTIAVEFDDDNQSNQRSIALAIYPNDWSGNRQDPFSLRRPLDYDALKWYR